MEHLAGAGRWDEAAEQARHLTRYFRAPGGVLHQVAGESFDGLHAAARARDPEELGDFTDLLRELFAERPPHPVTARRARGPARGHNG